MDTTQLKALKTIRTKLKSFLSFLEDFIISFEKNEPRNGIDTSFPSSVFILFHSFFNTFTDVYNLFHNAFQEILCPKSYRKDKGIGQDKQEGEEKNETENEEIVKIKEKKREDGSIETLTIKIPMLGKKVPRFVQVTGMSKKHTCVIEHSTLYSHEIREALYPYQAWLSSIKHAVIDYAFYYPKETKYALDSDNHDTKSTTDAIAAFFPDYDSPRNCSFIYRSVFTDSLPTGTYITIIPSTQISNISFPLS